MSYLSGNTKKVFVYGRKAEIRVVNRHSAFTLLDNDENDPFGFFKPQSRPKATYGRSRASALPSKVYSEQDDSAGDSSVTVQSQAYDTVNSSASFHSACSSGSSGTSKAQSRKASDGGGQRKALVSKGLNEKPQPEAESAAHSKSRKTLTKAIDSALDATPKAHRMISQKKGVDSPKAVRKTTALQLPNESTPPQPIGRTSRRAAQAARMAIQDYDFTDRDMTPRRPVPTKSYFAEKARQLAGLALEEEQEKQRSKGGKASGSSKAIANGTRSGARKSMTAGPRQTPATGSTLASAIAVSDSSLSSVSGVSDSSFEDGGTSQTSFSRSDESGCSTRGTSAAEAKSKPKQNTRVTRRIAASSDDDDDDDGALNSDDESEQDPALQLAAQVADLAVSDEDEATQSDDHLTNLLAAASQTKLESFSAVIQRLRSNSDSSKSSTARRRLEKIGEASYSEVFKIFPPSKSTSTTQGEEQEAIVLKIIPVSSSTSSSSVDENQANDLPYTSPSPDVTREIQLMQLISHHSSSFVTLRTAYIVRGAYPSALLQAWDRWDARRRAKTGTGAENARPHVLAPQQVYALLVMSDGGVDLESLRVKTWLHAASILAQVVGGLAGMERACEFEHRDLHWGNVLVQAVERDLPSPLGEQDTAEWLTDPSVTGVRATIIDFTLSRASLPTNRTKKAAEVLHYPFTDPSLFGGSGDPQFDVYREMRTVTRGEWQMFCPVTNVLWLRYLVHKLVDVKCAACRVPKAVEGREGEGEGEREWRAYEWLQRALVGLDAAAQKVLDEAKGEENGRRARRSVLTARSRAGRGRKGRATMAVTPVTEKDGEAERVTSAAELVSFLGH